MAGSVEGGKAAAKTNKNKYGDDFYVVLGRKGGQAGRTGGFAADRELASRVGKIGGTISRRGDATKLTKAEATAARKRILSELSQMQTSKLSSKHGNQRPW